MKTFFHFEAAILTAPIGQRDSQIAHPIHFCGFASSQKTLMSPRNFGIEIRSARGVQSQTQIEQALHNSLFITGLGHNDRFKGTQT